MVKIFNGVISEKNSKFYYVSIILERTEKGNILLYTLHIKESYFSREARLRFFAPSLPVIGLPICLHRLSAKLVQGTSTWIDPLLR